MRILILDTTPVRRGAQIFARDLADELNRRGDLVKIVYLYKTEESVHLSVYSPDENLGADANHFFEKFPSVHPLLVRRLVRVITVFNPEILLLNGSRTYKYGAAARPFLSVKPVVVFRLIDSVIAWNRNGLKQFYYKRFVFRAMDGLVAVSEASLKDFRKLFPGNKRCHVIHRALSTERLNKAPSREKARKLFKIEDEDRVLLFLGNLTSQKRPDRFIKIIKLIRERFPRVKGWMVGDGRLREIVERSIEEESLGDVIRVWGYQHDVSQFIAASDLILLTSDTEGLPGVVLEAAYLRVPAVSALVGGVTECVEDGKTGFLVQKDAIQEYANCAIKLLNNEVMRHEMGISAYAKTKSDFDLKIIADRYTIFFKLLKVII